VKFQLVSWTNPGHCPECKGWSRRMWVCVEARPMSETYRIVRLYFDDNHPEHRTVIATGLTLDEAQAHCQDPATRGPDLPDTNGCPEWFDAYYDEGRHT